MSFVLIFQSKNVAYDPSATPSGKCPHAKAAQQAAAMAQKEVEKVAAQQPRSASTVKPTGVFDYGNFYEAELEKKHQDK